MYSQDMLASIKKVEATRASRIGVEPRRMSAEEKDALLKEFHPDYRDVGFDTLRVGVNKGDKVPVELRALLEGKSRVAGLDLDLEHPDYDVDVLVIGGGGAGSSAAVMAHENGANVMIVTKLRIGDANTMMAEGGIQAADKANDSPAPALPRRLWRRPLRGRAPSFCASWSWMAPARSSGSTNWAWSLTRPRTAP